jgi:nucleoside-diphosphate-sugar epimerase
VDIDNLEVERALGGDPVLPVTLLRLPVTYGPHDPQRRLAHYVRRMDDGQPTIVLDERLARFRQSRGYVENVAAAVVLAATADRARGRTYNVAERHTPPWREWLDKIAEVCGWEGEIIALPRERLPQSLHFPAPDGQDLYASSERIREELSYIEPIDPSEGLSGTRWSGSESRKERNERPTTPRRTPFSPHCRSSLIPKRPPASGASSLSSRDIAERWHSGAC